MRVLPNYIQIGSDGLAWSPIGLSDRDLKERQEASELQNSDGSEIGRELPVVQVGEKSTEVHHH